MKEASFLIATILFTIWCQNCSAELVENIGAENVGLENKFRRNQKTRSVNYEYPDLDDQINDGMHTQDERRNMFLGSQFDLNYNFEGQSGDANGGFLMKQYKGNADPSTQTIRKGEFPFRTGTSSIRVAPNRYNYGSVVPTTYKHSIPSKNGAGFIEERNDGQRNSPIQFITDFITKLWTVIKSWFKA